MRPLLLALALTTACPAGWALEADGTGWGLQDANEKLYIEQCANCHGDRLEGAALGSTLISPPLQHGNTLEDIVTSISEGFPEQGMPAWKDALSASQIRRLAMLILELQAGFTYDSVDPLGVPLVIPDAPFESDHYHFKLESIAQDLQHPFSIAPLPDGRMLYTEKSVGLSMLSRDRKTTTLIKGTPRVYDDNSFRGAALIGSGWIQEVALHPGYANNGWVYLSFGDRCSDCNALSRAKDKPVTMTQLVRGRIEGDRWVDQQLIWRADRDHYLTGHNQAIGARIAFDNAGHVFLSVGGLSQETGIQDLDRPYGKIHRIRDDGKRPSDNPFVTTKGAITSTYSYGHRNPQGLAFDSRTGQLWATEHGPRGGDELNLIEAGANYGWPMVSYGMWYDGNPIRFAEELGIDYDPQALTDPVRQWTPSPGVSSIVFYEGEPFAQWSGSLLVATMRKERLLRLTIEGDTVTREDIIIDKLGRFRDIEVGADGNIYLLIEQYHGSHIVKMTPFEPSEKTTP